MKKFKRFGAAALAAALLGSCMALYSCGSGEVEYTVNVKNALGDPYTTGIVVNFMDGDEKVAMQPIDENGTCKKVLPKGKYTVELSYTDGEDAYYCESNATLTKKETTADVILANKVTTEAQSITIGTSNCDAYDVKLGCTYVELSKGERSYFLFTPTQGGHYVFSITNGADVTIGHYGAPHFVQEHNLAKLDEDGTFAIDVKDGMIGQGEGGTSIYVIGIDAGEAESCVLGIDRTGDAVKTIEDEPWTVYEGTHIPSPYTLPAGSEIKEFDLTASTDTYKFVLDEATGYYHLDSKDGPLVLVRLAEDCDYIACYKTILEKQGVVKYFFKGDEKTYENFEKKENYSDCLLEYIGCADENLGVYPLTEDLMYIIQQNGDHLGWWDIDGSTYRFLTMDDKKDTSINVEIAWLLMCCYVG